ncbi:DUF4293 domain-containing protein [Arachidicoccus ginsenosidivorans]|jgi:hypothetical protein|uniref:DUF4293 family protein n=1 Tax=Arachidicoccus ginsenosidivorans TaxID=496057 RepID=A0A5B8VMG9_9BACT|nr:DUF4293 domain-containing protein [Arachidicoccus ginsenosidivorans]QEC72764.1 DUF4293 family protein [Arachidicoccus ginsenosidivorans]
MIQRIQSFWLLVVVILAALSLKFGFYVGTWLSDGVQHPQIVLNGHNPSILVFADTIIIIVVSLIAIFMYKNRKQQMLLTVVDLLLSLGLFYFYYQEINAHFLPGSGTLALTSIFVFLIPIFIIMAIRGISRDMKLLKRADRLRG